MSERKVLKREVDEEGEGMYADTGNDGNGIKGRRSWREKRLE